MKPRSFQLCNVYSFFICKIIYLNLSQSIQLFWLISDFSINYYSPKAIGFQPLEIGWVLVGDGLSWAWSQDSFPLRARAGGRSSRQLFPLWQFQSLLFLWGLSLYGACCRLGVVWSLIGLVKPSECSFSPKLLVILSCELKFMCMLSSFHLIFVSYRIVYI